MEFIYFIQGHFMAIMKRMIISFGFIFITLYLRKRKFAGITVSSNKGKFKVEFYRFATFLQRECERLEWYNLDKFFNSHHYYYQIRRTIQPYNSHIPFTLQFFIDFSLYGMDYVHLQKVYHRKQCFNLPGPLRS